MCGAVRFVISNLPREFGACHCDMCRRWTGSALLAVSVPTADIRFSGTGHIARRQTSAWAERAWCRDCGSPLYYRVTLADAPATHEIPIGLLDDANGLVMTREIFHDRKPDCFAYAGSRETLTEAETLALYAPEEPGQ